MKRDFMPTLEDVARRANVSVSTASRILTNDRHGRFSSETRARVLHASQEIGYRPNLAARSLISGQSNIFAVVFPRVIDTPFTALMVLQIIAGIESACSERGYHLLVSSPRFQNGQFDAHYLQLLGSGYLDGVIIQDENVAFSALEPVIQAGVPAVVVGNREYPYFVRGDDYRGGSMLMAHLLELGHKRIGIIGLPAGAHYSSDLRAKGAFDTAARYGLPPECLFWHDGEFTRESALTASRSLLDRHPEITALMALNDRMAIGALQGMLQTGRRIPEDISIVGYDNLPQAGESIPPLTTIDHSIGLWGGAAVDMLVELRAGGQPQPRSMETTLIVRGSTAPPREGRGHSG
jgi:LacI family transcriptional regulator